MRASATRANSTLGGQAQGLANARHRLPEIRRQQRLAREIAVDRVPCTSQDVVVDQPARDVGRAGMRQSLLEPGQVAGLCGRHLAAQRVRHAGTHRVDVDAFEHRLLERGDLLQLRAALLGHRTLRARLQQAVDGQAQPAEQGQQGDAGGEHAGAMTLRELAQQVTAGRRHRLQRTRIQEALQVVRQRRRGCVARVAVVAHGLRHHPVELAAEGPAHPRQRLAQRVLQAARLIRRQGRQLLGRQPQCPRLVGDGLPGHQRPMPGQQFAEDHADCVHVAAGIQGGRIVTGLLRAHVGDGADERAKVCAEGIQAGVPNRAGNPEVDDLGNRRAVLLRY